jgi:hypothetical protein
MKSTISIRALFAVSALFISILTIHGRDETPDLLVGKWTKSFDGRTVTFTIKSDQKYEVEFAGDDGIDVLGSFIISGTKITFNDEAGDYSADVPGVYEFQVSDTSLEFTIVDDPVYGRSLLLAGTWLKARNSENESQSLFNGSDLSGWHIDVPAMDVNPDTLNPFIARDGMLVSLGTPRGHVITDKEFQNYRLTVEYRFAGTPGNCGVLVHVSTPRALYKMFPKSMEVQMQHTNAGDFWCIVEDIEVPDMETRRGPKENWGITEEKGRNIKNLTDDSEKPVGEWNTMVIEAVGNEIKVWVNGDLVNHGFNCTAEKGQIALQAEGSEVEFRKLELMAISRISDKNMEE